MLVSDTGTYITAMLHVKHRISAWVSTYFSQCDLLISSKERSLAIGICKKWLNLLHNSSNKCLCMRFTLLLRRRAYTSKKVGYNFAEERVDEEGEASAEEGVLRWTGGGQKVGGVGISDELGDDARLSNDSTVVGESGDLAAL